MSELKNIHFIIPDFTQFISGGNLYNQELVDAMKQHSARTIHQWTFEEFSERYKNIEKGLFIVDTLYLEEMKDLLALKKEGQKFHLLVHHLESLYPPKGHSSKEWFIEKEKPLLLPYDGFIVTSEYTANYLRRHRMRKPILVIPPAISFIPKRIPLRKSKPIKAFLAANVIERKGVLPFIKILAQQLIEPKDFSLEIAGDLTMEKDYANTCLRLVQDTSLKSYCRFLGPLSPKAIQKKYKNANLLIATSFFETYGMTLQEGVVWKLPILAIKGGNTTYHIQNGLNGYLFDNMEDLVVRLKSLINNPEWMDLLLKQNAQIEDIASYTWKDAAKRTITSIERVSYNE